MLVPCPDLLFGIHGSLFGPLDWRRINLEDNQTLSVIFTVVEPSCVIVCGCMPTMPKSFEIISRWRGWSRLSSLVSPWTRAKTSHPASNEATNDNSAIPARTWHLLPSSDGVLKTSKSARTESTERFELVNVNGLRSVHASGDEPWLNAVEWHCHVTKEHMALPIMLRVGKVKVSMSGFEWENGGYLPIYLEFGVWAPGHGQE